MPFIPRVLRNLHTNPNNTKLSDHLERLLVLESEFGALSGFSPALDAVIDFLTTLEDAVQPDDITMKNLLYSMLSAEGSDRSQQVLIGALQRASTESERTSIVSYIAFIRHASRSLLTELEQVIISGDNHLDPLLLAYGALASETTEESEQRIVSFLLNRLEEAPRSVMTMVHYIHALGNTGSPFALDTIISFHNHSDLEVQLASINAMRKLINDPLVEETLYSILQTTPASYEHVVAIAETLSEGAKYFDERDIDYTPSMELQTALVASAVQFGDIQLAELILSFVETFETPESEGLAEALENIIATEKKFSQSRDRRGTDWDESNLDYDVVASQGSRAADVRNYTNHRAYIWGKTLGISQANLKVGAGLFIGHRCPNLKAFGKAVAQANLLRWSWNILHAEVLLEKTDSQVRRKLYFKVLNNVLIDLSNATSFSNCTPTPSRTLYSSPRYSLPRVSYSIFIYVGTLSLYLQPHVQANIDFRTELCANSSTLRGFAGIGPRLTLTVEGGVRGNILSLARGGVSVDVIFEYQIEGSGEGRLCASCITGSPRAQACVGAYEGWPNNRINLYAWYQFRRIRMCRGRIWSLRFKYPCGIEWGTRHRWDSFSRTWNLPSRPLTSIYNICGGMHDPTCPLPNSPPPPVPDTPRPSLQDTPPPHPDFPPAPSSTPA